MQKKLIIYLMFFLISSGIGGSITKVYWEGKYTKLQLEYTETLAENQNYLIERQKQVQNITTLQNERDLAVQKARERKVEYIEKEIIKYEQNDNGSDCVLDDAWVRIYNESKPMPKDP